MEIIRPDFEVINHNRIFTSNEVEYIDAVVNGYPVKSGATKLQTSIKKKIGVTGWGRAIALLFKGGFIKTLCLILTMTMMTEEITMAFSPDDQNNIPIVRLRLRTRTRRRDDYLTV